LQATLLEIIYSPSLNFSSTNIDGNLPIISHRFCGKWVSNAQKEVLQRKKE
jgi:hypothetical protein